jgi:hypothetical protein
VKTRGVYGSGSLMKKKEREKLRCLLRRKKKIFFYIYEVFTSPEKAKWKPRTRALLRPALRLAGASVRTGFPPSETCSRWSPCCDAGADPASIKSSETSNKTDPSIPAEKQHGPRIFRSKQQRQESALTSKQLLGDTRDTRSHKKYPRFWPGR